MSLKPPILTVGKFEFYTVTQTGISFDQTTPRAEWLDVVKRLTHFYEGSAMAKERCLMCLADALNFGADAFGESHAQAIDGMRQALGLTPKTIANAQWVYGRIEAGRRREGLTLGHMSVIAGLAIEVQDEFIDDTLKRHLSVTDLKTEVATRFPKTKRNQTRKTKAQPDDPDTAETVLHKLRSCANWFKSNEPTEKMKDDLAQLYRTYRRKWMGGHKK